MASSTKKRGQTMTLFLLLGIVLIAVVGFMLFLRGGMEGTGVEDAADLGLSTTSFKAHAHQCLRQEVLNAVDKYGVIDGQGPYIGAYVRKNLPKCIEWDFYEEQGFAITAGNPEVQVEIAPDTLLVDVKYPIEGEDERGAFSFEELYYYLPRGSSGQLRFDGADRTEEEVSVSSSDGDAELIIPEGTVVKDADGNPVAEVKLHVLERDFNGLANPLIVGMVAYEITPHVTFSNPVTLKMTYREQDIPSGVAESTLRLAQFERNYNMWFSVPTTVDEEKNTLTASFTHFSPVAPVIRCGEDTYSEFPARYGWGAFIMSCNVGGSAGYVTWATDDGKDLFEDQAQDTGELIFIPSERAGEGEEPVWSLDGQATPPTNDQVSLSPCTINDWDRDDRIDTVDQVTTECVHVTYQEGEGAQPIERVDELDAGECAGANLQAILESCQSFVNEESIGRQDAFKQQEELAGREIPTQDGIKDHESFEEETVSGCFRQIDESGNSVVGGGNWNPATPNTYGYRAVEGIDDPWDLPGGFAILEFRFAGNGGACVATGADGKPMIELEVSSPSGDTIDYRINPYTGTTEEPEFLTLAPADSGTAAAVQAWLSERWAGYKGTLDAKDFEVYSQVDGVHFINKVYIRMDNANEDGAVIAQVDRFVIHGTGVTFEFSEHYAECTVTVQDRINYLCGCDHNCSTRQGLVEGEDDWGAGSELNTLAAWRGEWNPSAGSVVNGQTMLCDLDMADPRITSLRETGWTPFGGYCGDDGPVGMERVVTGGECTTVGMGACDYATNNAVECIQVAPEAAEAGTPESAARWQVRADGECGEDQVCRIMGGGATCVGEQLPEITDGDSCVYLSGGQNVVLDSVAQKCYQCYKRAGYEPGSEDSGQLWYNSNLDPQANCEERVNLCGPTEGVDRKCADRGKTCADLEGEWSDYDDEDATNECVDDPSVGDVCCQRTEVEPGVCPEGYDPTTATGATRQQLLNECSGWGVGFECTSNAATSTYCGRNAAGNWFRCFDTCDTGTTCGGTENKCVEDECSTRTCRDYDMDKVEAGDWPGICNDQETNPCGFECVAKQGWCLEPETSDCAPTSTVMEPGASGDARIGSDQGCWICPEGESVEWERATSQEQCGCSKFGRQYAIGAFVWDTDNTCKRCAAFNQWTTVEDSQHGECSGKCWTWEINNLPYYFYPGQTLCVGKKLAWDYAKIQTCYVDGSGELLFRTEDCQAGCQSGYLIDPNSCTCPSGECPECPRTDAVPEPGDRWDLYYPDEDECYYCNEGWTLRAGGSGSDAWRHCWCDRTRSDGFVRDEETVWYSTGTDSLGECWRCVKEGGFHNWNQISNPPVNCPDLAKCTYGSTDVGLGEWVCVEGETQGGNIKQCLGGNEWGTPKVCEVGCRIGTVFESDSDCE